MLLWLGIATFVAGCVLWYRSQHAAERVPRMLGRFGMGAAALGLGTLTMMQPGLPWTVASICFSALAIGLIGSVLMEIRRRK